MNKFYVEVIDLFSRALRLSNDAIENLLGSLLIFLSYLFLRLVFTRYLKNKINEKYKEQFLKEVVPHVLKLLAIGFLLKIWLTGEASFASFFEVPAILMGHIVDTIYIYLFYLGTRLAAEVFIEITYSDDERKIFAMRRTSKIFLGIVCIILLIKVWIATSGNYSTYFGLLSAGLAIALQDVIVSLAGWCYLIIVKPFNLGDRIQIGEYKGDVIDLKLFQFFVLETGNWVNGDQPTGRILNFPNSFVFKNVIANYNAGFQFIFSEMPIMITFESDWKLSLKLLNEILFAEVGEENAEAISQIKRASRTMQLSFAHLDPKVIISVADSGVVLTLRFLCKIRERRFLEAKIWHKVLEAFGGNDSIDFAYPTNRYYVNHLEGKANAGGPKLN